MKCVNEKKDKYKFQISIVVAINIDFLILQTGNFCREYLIINVVISNGLIEIKSFFLTIQRKLYDALF